MSCHKMTIIPESEVTGDVRLNNANQRLSLVVYIDKFPIDLMPRIY